MNSASHKTGQVPSAPVRSAPLRRRRKTEKPEPGAAEPTTTEPTTTEPTTTEPTTTEDATPEGDVSLTKSPAESADTSDSATDPDALVASMSYRERRRRRLAASGDTAPAQVAKVSALRARSDRSILKLVATSLAVLIIVGCLVASAVFAIALGRIDHQRDLRAEYSGFAQQMTVTMTSLNPGNVDAAMKTMSDKTSGTAQQRLNESMGQAVSLVRDQKLDVSSRVISDAVTKAADDEGSVIVVYGWQMKPADPKEQTIVQTFRWRVDITRINGQLKMTDFEWVT
ncbi:hypothetical protein ACPXB3_21750 [Gordonia sp. DT219]|uniref:hypothetical protein n=1 Tax=Gordonia sp. DT219 TaxID=3416658 RepID=UPI003CF6D8C5